MFTRLRWRFRKTKSTGSNTVLRQLSNGRLGQFSITVNSPLLLATAEYTNFSDIDSEKSFKHGITERPGTTGN
jgi:hypothetical protein